MAWKACVLSLLVLSLFASVAFVAPQTSGTTSRNGVLESARGQRQVIISQDARQFAPPSSTSITSSAGSFSLFCRLSAAAACAVIASSARKQQRAEKVVVRIFPSRAMHRQKTMRRLEPYGEIPAWSRKPLLKKRLVQPWRKRPVRRLSPFGRYLYERSRVRCHYNINVRQLTKYVLRAFKEGRKHPIDHLMAILESRIDNFCWRVGIAPTMAAARFMVRENHIQIRSERVSHDYKDPEWVTVNTPSHLLKLGDEIRVRPKPRSQGLAKRHQDEDGPVEVPSHLEWDRENLIGRYNDLCDSQEVGITVNEDHLISKFLGPQGVRQRHIRWFEGTTIPIEKIYNGGRIRPTPENILNMKRGFGLNARGYKRPPCLWGRKKNPLNNPWEYGSKVKV
jgi:small subunit ribosomal protein S4